MNTIQKKRGQYLGTKVEHRWWRRYKEGEFNAHGRGEYWIKDGCLFFQLNASQQPITLPLQRLVEIKVCRCREGSGGIPVLKLVWEKDGRWLSSSFILSGLVDKSNNLLASLRNVGWSSKAA